MVMMYKDTHGYRQPAIIVNANSVEYGEEGENVYTTVQSLFLTTGRTTCITDEEELLFDTTKWYNDTDFLNS